MANASINFKISIKNGIFIVLHNFFVVVAYNIKFSSRHRRPLSLIYVFFFSFFIRNNTSWFNHQHLKTAVSILIFKHHLSVSLINAELTNNLLKLK